MATIRVSEPEEPKDETSTDLPSENPEKESSEKPSEEDAKEPSEKPSEEDAKESSEKPSEEDAKESSEKPSEEDAKESSEKPSEEDAKEAVESKGLDFAAYQREFQEQGELSEETYKALDKAGIPKEIVDQYIESQQAVAELQTREIHGLVGGEQKFNELLQWAAKSLPDDEKKAFNDRVEKADSIAELKQIYKGLHAQFQAAYGSEGSLVTGESGAGNQSLYRGRSELEQDMADERYRASPAFRQRVQEKLIRSKQSGAYDATA